MRAVGEDNTVGRPDTQCKASAVGLNPTEFIRGGRSRSTLGRVRGFIIWAWVRPKGHLLPFCSHTILKYPQNGDTKDYHQETSNFLLFPYLLREIRGLPTRSQGSS